MNNFFLRTTVYFVAVFFCAGLVTEGARAGTAVPGDPVTKEKPVPPVNIGSRLELFVDGYLIDRLTGGGKIVLHHPQPREIVMIHDQPWEGSGSGYHSIFKDGDKYKMYYKAWQHEASSDLTTAHPLYCAYAESEDGIHWTKPDLGLYEFKGSRNNNIVFVSGKMGKFNLNAGHPAVFKDDNPDAPADAKYKALLIDQGLIAFKSADGIHWNLMSDDYIIKDGAFDSQNLAFWDADKKEYRAYWRFFSKGTPDKPYIGKRLIRTAVSKDFIHWTEQANIQYEDSPEEELYTNQIKPYYRAPHILLGFPARYIERGWSPSMKALPELEEREKRAAKSLRYGTALTESLLMASRDGVNFKRWNEAFLRPGIERNGTWTYGDQYIGWHLVETKAADPGAPNELSLYATEHYWKDRASYLRRYTLRLDGFVSVNAPLSGGELVTRPIIFKGNSLSLNFSTSAAGGIQVEVIDAATNRPVKGFTLDDCYPVFGDTISRKVEWKKGSDLSPLQGKAVKLRFVLKDADLYAFQFQ
ncbi:glycoside hydrolase family protein [Niabella drilacis]|uniref:Glycosyl hydrolases family 32 N-terminal domain-containing protein n=1 Tax=Niabella drilacis (strain DSM 25811 / CCM 8410 / CCUG 62505 / LMG 26954 / E90) TaxID=1285928 RepID=A0A1G6S483_NIADE|nr:hypothetical protein [Niabella drilacis]SDD11720.1 hypothetical protein SAMN04487894_10689 [Niabella drilacis]